MKLSEVFERAAVTIERGERGEFGCCDVIERTTKDFKTFVAAIEYFTSLFGLSCSNYWWPCDTEHDGARILALLFASAIARSEGK